MLNSILIEDMLFTNNLNHVVAFFFLNSKTFCDSSLTEDKLFRVFNNLGNFMYSSSLLYLKKL